MATAQILESRSHQTAYLPEQSQLSESEVLVQWPDDTVILLPQKAPWQTFLNGINSFTDDFFENGRDAEIPAVRDSL